MHLVNAYFDENVFQYPMDVLYPRYINWLGP